MDPEPKKWHIAPWPALAWLETILKLIAIALAISAGFNAIMRGDFLPPVEETWWQAIILGVLSTGLLLAIYDRILEREIIAMAFVILNNLGHWGLTLAMLTRPKPVQTLLLFSGLMLIGDLIKLVFIQRHKFQVRDTPKAMLYGLTLLYAVGYLALLLIELLP